MISTLTLPCAVAIPLAMLSISTELNRVDKMVQVIKSSDTYFEVEYGSGVTGASIFTCPRIDNIISRVIAEDLVVESVQPLLLDPNKDVRMLAAYSLGQLGSLHADKRKQVLNALSDLADDPDYYVKVHAGDAIRKLRSLRNNKDQNE